MSGKVYFITGANRGIGIELVKILSSNANNTVIATARDPAKATDLIDLASKNGNVHVLKLDIASDGSIEMLDSQLSKVAADGIDVYYANAGIATEGAFVEALTVSKSVWLEHYTVNVLGPLFVAKKLIPYLEKKETKLIYFTSSVVASMNGFFGASTSAYGQSKAALNHTAKVLSFELGPKGYTVVAVHPGVVSTDMGADVASWLKDPAAVEGLKSLTIPPKVSAEKQIEVLEKLTKEDNGKFLAYDGSELPF